MRPLRVILADDHTMVRAGFRSLLARMSSVEVLGEANDGRELLAMVAKLRPDVVLMDIAMPGLNGLEATARLKEDFPHISVIILSMHANEEYVLQALRSGASGYLLKNADPVELELAIRAVADGKTYLTPEVSRQVIDDYRRRTLFPDVEPLPLGVYDVLTSRQREVLQLIAEGLSTREVAETLTISIKTVETHRRQIMERLGIDNLAGLVRYAVRQGLVEDE